MGADRCRLILALTRRGQAGRALAPRPSFLETAGVTGLLQDVLGKNPKTTVVVIEEIPTDNWGIGGQSVTEIRAR